MTLSNLSLPRYPWGFLSPGLGLLGTATLYYHLRSLHPEDPGDGVSLSLVEDPSGLESSTLGTLQPRN